MSRLELLRLSPLAPQASVSTNFTTSAHSLLRNTLGQLLQPLSLLALTGIARPTSACLVYLILESPAPSNYSYPHRPKQVRSVALAARAGKPDAYPSHRVIVMAVSKDK